MKYDIRKTERKPNYKNLLKVLECKEPSRPTLFEFFMNDTLYAFLLEKKKLVYSDIKEYYVQVAEAFAVAGYDYVTLLACDLMFNPYDKHGKESASLNESAVVYNRKSFNAFEWPDAKVFDYSRLDYVGSRLPDGMKMVPCGPGGVLENVIALMGYDNLCYALYDEPGLVENICHKVGSTLVEYYRITSPRDDVVAVISNDDWGFNTQTMISTEHLRKYIIPWHREIVDVIHSAGKPAILHSCGKREIIINDTISIGYDAIHSFEDNICPVEKQYKDYNGKIAVLGGIDLDFVCRATPDEVYARSRKMVETAKTGYALGSGNSIPEYVPIENYMAMIAAVYE